MSFLHVLWRVCLIPDNFILLRGQTLRRAVAHFVLYLLLLSLLLGYLHASRINKEIREACHGVMAQTGDLILSPEKGLQTEKNSDKVKRFLLNTSLSLDFYPGKTLQESAFTRVNTPYGLIFMDKGIVFWAENYSNMGKGRFVIAPMVLSMNESAKNKIQMDLSAGEAAAFLQKNFVLAPGEKLSLISGRFDAESLSGQLTVSCSMLLFFAVLFAVLFSGAGTVLLYSLAQYLWFNRMTQELLTYKQILCILLYASYAPLLCGGLCSLIPDPLLAPQTFFVLLFLFYSLIVLRNVRRVLVSEHISTGPDDTSFPPEDGHNR